MSQLKTNAIRHISASSDAVTLASDGTCTAKITNQPPGNRNLITNGAMTFNQRGHSGAISDGAYSLDRYRFNHVSSGAWSITQADLGTAGPTGFRNSLKIDCTTANGSLSSGSHVIFQQKIEAQDLQQLAYGSSGAKSVTISFWVKSNKTGTFPLELYCSDPSTNRQHVKLYTISSAGTWEKKTLTFAGDTAGQINNDNGTGMQIDWWLAAGTDFTSGSNDPQWVNDDSTERAAGLTVNLADSTSNYLEITGIQFEVGDVATDFEHRSYGDELAKCQRYYNKLADGSESTDRPLHNGTFFGAHNFYGPIDFPVAMRASPTIDCVTGSDYYMIYYNSTTTDCDAISLNNVTTKIATLIANTNLTGTANASGWCRTKNASSYVALTAEL